MGGEQEQTRGPRSDTGTDTDRDWLTGEEEQVLLLNTTAKPRPVAAVQGESSEIVA